MLQSFDFYKETDIVVLSENVPYGMSYMNLSYIILTNHKTEENIYRNVAYLTDNFAFTDDSITFMIEDAAFYVTEEWGSVW